MVRSVTSTIGCAPLGTKRNGSSKLGTCCSKRNTNSPLRSGLSVAPDDRPAVCLQLGYRRRRDDGVVRTIVRALRHRRNFAANSRLDIHRTDGFDDTRRIIAIRENVFHKAVRKIGVTHQRWLIRHVQMVGKRTHTRIQLNRFRR